MTLPISILTTEQTKLLDVVDFEQEFINPRTKEPFHIQYRMHVYASHHDRKKQGFNRFSLYADIFDKSISLETPNASGRMHDYIMAHAPEHKHLIKWNALTTAGPDLKTALWFKGNRQFDKAKQYAYIHDVLLEKFNLETLSPRVPKLMEEFKSVVENLGMIY
jgi:hypothetical protein